MLFTSLACFTIGFALGFVLDVRGKRTESYRAGFEAGQLAAFREAVREVESLAR